MGIIDFDGAVQAVEAARRAHSANNADGPAELSWPQPQSLPDDVPSVAPFDADLLPEALRPWVMDIAERMQCPADFPAVGIIVALSSIIGARAVVSPKERDDWQVVPNLWGMVVGRPGIMKSPALAQAIAPLERLETLERERWQSQHDEWAIDARVAELAAKSNEQRAQKEAAQNPAKARMLLADAGNVAPDEPIMRRYLVNDSTVEKLADILTVTPWGLLVYRDELNGLLRGMDREGQEGARGFYLTGYDGNQGYAVDRIIRGSSYVPRVCLALLGGTQPGKLQAYVREAVSGGTGDDGLLQRFGLIVWPDMPGQWCKVDRWPDTPAKQAAWGVFQRLDGLQPASEDGPQVWRFSAAAQALYWQWAEPFEHELRQDDLHPAIASHLAKWRKLIPALALIFAIVDTPDSGNTIHEQELLRALVWAQYLRSHVDRVYAAAVIPETAGARTLLGRIRTGKLADADGVIPESFTPREVAVKHWTGLATPRDVRAAADTLAEYGWLRLEVLEPGSSGGRPSERYLIHPQLLAGRA